MEITEFDYELPEELIAQSPLKDRTNSRLLLLDKKTGHIEHHSFKEWINYLEPGDTVVLNDTKVIPARLFGVKTSTGAKIEVLLLKAIGEDRWEALVRPAKRVKTGTRIGFGGTTSAAETEDSPGGSPVSEEHFDLVADVAEEGAHGHRVLQFHYQGIFQEILDRLGEMPLPPYIKEQLQDRDRYQTVYAKHEGSAAAPTAGLHLTESYLEAIRKKGVSIAYVTLHVGLGTFRPVSAERIEEHEMHAEYYEMTEETAKRLTETKQNNGRIIAVGTTSVRVLESIAQRYDGRLHADKGWTSIFIYPGYQFLAVDSLLTNFHLPKSTLIMLVSTLAGKEAVLRAYREAVKERYRFFSFGDAMFISDLAARVYSSLESREQS